MVRPSLLAAVAAAAGVASAAPYWPIEGGDMYRSSAHALNMDLRTTSGVRS